MSPEPETAAQDRTLPREIPIFPLDGVLLLPRGQLPLNIFEPRYLAMAEDCFSARRLIGMVQPDGGAAGRRGPSLYATGCAGRITSFEETPDGRYRITLTGVSRFRIRRELRPRRGYRRVRPDWKPFAADLETPGYLGIDRPALKNLLGGYFRLHEMSCDWGVIDGTSDDKLITCLSMICPFGPKEKQALLEAPTGQDRAALFMALLDMAIRGTECAPAGCGPAQARACH
jgi:Lon protease-like protein